MVTPSLEQKSGIFRKGESAEEDKVTYNVCIRKRSSLMAEKGGALKFAEGGVPAICRHRAY